MPGGLLNSDRHVEQRRPRLGMAVGCRMDAKAVIDNPTVEVVGVGQTSAGS